MSLHAATIRAFEWPSHKTITSTQIKVTLLYKFFGKDTGHSKESDFCNPLEQKSPTSEYPRPTRQGILNHITQEGNCIPFLAPSLLAIILVHRTGYSAECT